MEFIDAKFFVAVATLLFVVVTFKPIKKVLLSMIDERIDKIKSDLAEAARLKDEATKILKESEENLLRSEKEAAEIISHAKLEAENIISKTKEKLEKDIETRKAIAFQKIKSLEESALLELKKSVASIAIGASAKVIQQQSSDDDFKNLVDGSIEKLSKTIH
jgi:F-type H+-transporting ATPase subunit b